VTPPVALSTMPVAAKESKKGMPKKINSFAAFTDDSDEE
jgi:hypothetical protein